MSITINGSGTIGGVSVGGLPDGIVDTDMLASGAVTASSLPAGSVLQVVSTTKTDTYSVSLARATTATTDAISTSITPTSTSSKILIIASLQLGLSQANRIAAILYKNGSAISGYIGDSSGNRSQVSVAAILSQTYGNDPVNANFLDSPNTTSSVTYSFRLRHGYGDTATAYLNRSHNDEDQDYQFRIPSTITLMEIAG